MKTVRRIPPAESGGVLIVAVLVLAACAVLAGFGRLRFYRRQVQVRLDRQREVQQTFATRSAIKWLESVDKVSKLPVETNRLGFETLLGDIRVSVCPAPAIFPESGNAGHFDSSDASHAARRAPENYGYVRFSGQQAGPVHWSTNGTVRYGFVLGDGGSAAGATNLVEIDLDGSVVDALWTSDPYGRRYMAQFSDLCQGTATNEGDTMFFGLTPSGSALFGSGKGEVSAMAVWMEQLSPSNRADDTKAPVRLWVRDRGTDACESEASASAIASKGLQLSGTHATVFDKTRIVNDNESAIQSTHTYGSFDMGDDFTKRFDRLCREAGGMRITLGTEARRPRD